MNKKKLIIPAAGLSTRFPNLRPKWLLTHPSGKLMIELIIDEFINSYEIILVTTEKICIEYNVENIFKNLYDNNVKIIKIPYQTSNSCETVIYALNNIDNINEFEFLIKDSDSYISFDKNFNELRGNFVVGIDTSKITNVVLNNKSFIKYDKYNFITDIIEKKISSNTISVGLYGIKSNLEYIKSYNQISTLNNCGEIFTSHVIFNMIVNEHIFKYVECEGFKDWGTLDMWNIEREKHTTYFCDFDGVLVKNKGKFGIQNWFNSEDEPIIENIEILKSKLMLGNKLIITTSRPYSLKSKIENFLKTYNISCEAIICDLPHSKRVLINDFSGNNPYPSAVSINIQRDSFLNNYL
jgi:hypothetical protein